MIKLFCTFKEKYLKLGKALLICVNRISDVMLLKVRHLMFIYLLVVQACIMMTLSNSVTGKTR
jgi:hypothetical protein